MESSIRGRIEVPAGRYCAEKSADKKTGAAIWEPCKFLKTNHDKPVCAAFRVPLEAGDFEGEKLHQKFIECFSACQAAEGAT